MLFSYSLLSSIASLVICGLAYDARSKLARKNEMKNKLCNSGAIFLRLSKLGCVCYSDIKTIGMYKKNEVNSALVKKIHSGKDFTY